MFLTATFFFLYVLFCAPSWIVGGSRDAVAQSALRSSASPKDRGISDHDELRFKEITIECVARQKGEYFVALLFARYGKDNKTIHKQELVNIFHNLGFSDDVPGFGEVHQHDVREPQEGIDHVSDDKLHTQHDHGLVEHNSNYLQVNGAKNSHDQTYINKLHHHHHNIDLSKCNINSHEKVAIEAKHDYKTQSKHRHEDDENVNSGVTSHVDTGNTPTHEHHSSLNSTHNLKPEFRPKPDSEDAKDEDRTATRSGGKKRKGKADRRVKKIRKEKNKKSKKGPKKEKKSEKEKEIQRRDKRDVAGEIQHSYDTQAECMTVQELLQVFDLEHKDKITVTDFLYISPAIIYQLDAKNCSHITHNALDSSVHGHSHMHNSAKSGGNIPAKVWGYSFVAVFIISLVGLLGVAIIPVMQKVFYNHLLQFLVALAVGALTGDALLHLLPHALGSAESHHDITAVWKGLCGLLGIYFFFTMERVLFIITENKRRRKAKYGIKPDPKSREEVMMMGHSDKPLKITADEQLNIVTKVTVKDNNPPKGHGHLGHTHADGKMPKSIATIAWMVIMGDGIHNFSDGLAIGAAFADSITGGFSTTIAVFCHELPHEIGDFAVLLRSGMSVKQAIIYNVVSSVLCFIGVAVGVALGNISDMSLWIFACVGGLFVYIALVDMLPEMTNKEHGGITFGHLFLQCCGMVTGSGIMLLIAVFEEDLLHALH
ncbi:zinc transporter ZIP10-like [Gigantopelta aegis]|uniref:zinc transporter ZIP10-like n=1 Tax=Gigantopelta aegis TaxID=1735272 RepID=UPI001B888602|nr:zinc transporter ZIP10-like [Gigantopelta aegis]